MCKFPCKQDENHLTTGDALTPHIFLAHRPSCPPWVHYSFTPQLSEQLSSAIQTGPATLVNGIQCPLKDKIILRLSVSCKTCTGNIKDGGLEGTPQLVRILQSTQTPPNLHSACSQTPQLNFDHKTKSQTGQTQFC